MTKRKSTPKPDDTPEVWEEYPAEAVPEEIPDAELVAEVPEIKAAPVPAKASKKKPGANAVALRIYLTVSGVRLDQMAGFQNFARRNKLGPMTMKAWHEAYAAFLNTPIT